jgi:hypothetical protein
VEAVCRQHLYRWRRRRHRRRALGLAGGLAAVVGREVASRGIQDLLAYQSGAILRTCVGGAPAE